MLVAKIIFYQDSEFTHRNSINNMPPDRILGGLTHNSNIAKNHSIILGGWIEENSIQAHSIMLGGSKSKQYNYNTKHTKTYTNFYSDSSGSAFTRTIGSS